MNKFFLREDTVFYIVVHGYLVSGEPIFVNYHLSIDKLNQVWLSISKFGEIVNIGRTEPIINPKEYVRKMMKECMKGIYLSKNCYNIDVIKNKLNIYSNASDISDYEDCE